MSYHKFYNMSLKLLRAGIYSQLKEIFFPLIQFKSKFYYFIVKKPLEGPKARLKSRNFSFQTE